MQSPAPSEYFPNIKFNYSFYTTGDTKVTLEYVNNNFLKCTGYAYSRAISTSFNGIIYALGGIETTNITATGTITANSFSGSGANLTSLNASNISTGIANINVGGTGKNTLSATQLLVGNNTDPIIQSSNLTWDNSNNIFTASNVAGNGSRLTTLNASNVTDGTLPVARGGTGSNTLVSGQLLIGNGLNPLTQTSGLTWSSNTLTVANITTGLLNSTNEITTNLNTTFMSGFKNTFYPLAFQNICSSTNLTKSVGADTDTVKTVYTTFGTHTLTATSVNATNSKIENIFDNNSSTYWTTATATYTRLSVDANYTANSSFSMNVTSLGVVYGQSIKVRLPRRIYLSNVLYIPFSLPTSITNGYILGSTNDSTWEPVYPITKFLTNLNEVSLVPTGILPTIYNGSSKAYQYFMVIATSIQGTTGAPINSTEKFAITNLQFTLYDNWVYHDNIISIGSFPNGYPVSNALDINGNTYISGKIFTDGGLNVLNGNVGIGLTNPNISYKLDVSGNINALSYTVNGSQFNSSQWTTSGTKIYYNGGNVGIGTTDPGSIFQVGNGGRLRIGSGDTDFTMIGSSDGGETTNPYNTRILLSGNNRPPNYGRIEYQATTGDHIFYTTYNTTERMRIANNGNIGLGTTNPIYKCHIKCSYNNEATGLHLDAGETNTDTNKYTLNIWPYVIDGGQVGWRFRTQNYVGGTHTPLTINNYGDVAIARNLSAGGAIYTDNSYMLAREVYARNSFDTRIRSDSGGMYLEMGYIGTGGSLLSLGAFGGNTEIVSGASRAIVMRTAGYNWLFVGASSYNPANSSYWNTVSDHRIKENIKKANLKICYNNIKNINLYRFNYIDTVGNATQHDKTQLGFIAQQVKQHYPKSVKKEKRRLEDKREIPDLLNVDVNQVNLTLFGAVKQLIRVVEKQSERIKKLEELLNIIDDDDKNQVEDDADEPYIKIECDEVDINTIEPSEPEGV